MDSCGMGFEQKGGESTMASAAKEWRNRRGHAVYGDLAYDLDRELRERELRHAGEAAPHAKPVAQPRVRSAVHAQVRQRQRQRLSVLTALGFCAAAGLAVLVLMSYIQLMGISNSVVSLKSQLEDLKSENVTLTAQYERMFDLNTVQEAAEAAGMSKPSSSQIYYIDLSDGDSVVVYQEEKLSLLDKLVQTVKDGVQTVMEYLD